MPKKRGRPRRERTREDQAIADTVERLLMWGFSGQGVFEAVGKAAKKVLQRNSAVGGALGPDQVKNLWGTLRRGWERYWPKEMTETVSPLKPRHLYTKRSLQKFCPDSNASVQELAEMLLGNDGKWPWPTERVWCPLEGKWEVQEVDGYPGDREPSLKWECDLKLMPKINRREK